MGFKLQLIPLSPGRVRPPLPVVQHGVAELACEPWLPSVLGSCWRRMVAGVGPVWDGTGMLLEYSSRVK